MTPEQQNHEHAPTLSHPDESEQQAFEVAPQTLDADAMAGAVAALSLYKNQAGRRKSMAGARLDEMMASPEGLVWNDETRSLLVDQHLMTVVGIARRYPVFDYELLDLIQEGNIGLLAAAREYPPEDDRDRDLTNYTDFSGYAKLKIMNRLRIAVRKMQNVVIAREHDISLRWLKKDEVELTQKLGRQPTIDELAVSMNMSSKQVQWLMLLSSEVWSLDESAEPGGMTLGETLEDTSLLDEMEASITEAELIEYLKTCISPRDLDIFLRYSGLGGHPEEPREQIANSYSLGVKHVSAILHEVRKHASAFLDYTHIVERAEREKIIASPHALFMADIQVMSSDAATQMVEATKGDRVLTANLIETLLQTIPHRFATYLRVRYGLQQDAECSRLTFTELAEQFGKNTDKSSLSNLAGACRRATLHLVDNVRRVVKNDFDAAKIPGNSVVPAASPLAFLYFCGAPLEWQQSPEDRVAESLRIMEEHGLDERQKAILTSLYGVDAPIRSQAELAEYYALNTSRISVIASGCIKKIRAQLKPAHPSGRKRLV